VIEFSESNTGYLQTTEWPFYTFDAVLIFLTMVLFNIIHPARYLVADPVVASTVNSSTVNQLEMNGTPVVTTDIIKPVESVQHA
jgi:hypothetical protein